MGAFFIFWLCLKNRRLSITSRRDFLKTITVAGSAAIINPIRALSSRYQDSSGHFGLHPFIENQPEAVFIMRTNVDVKTNSEAKKHAALDFTRSVIVPREEGVPLTHMIPIKPNLTCSLKYSYSLEYGMGIVTDADFVEGVIEGMKELGMSGDQFYIREVNCPSHFVQRGYYKVKNRTGADIRDLSPKVGVISESNLQWVDVPEGVWFKKIPYLWPINAPDTWFLNIAKFKAHGMGLTLCCKNHQGSIAHNYQELCSAYHPDGSMDIDKEHYHANAHNLIKANYDRHLADGISRWDRPGTDWNSGLGMERWATRTIDSHSVTPAGLHIIEGIYGRDGNGFHYGPNPEGNDDNKKGESWDYMTNIIIFGKNPYHVDIIGHWLGGHEPGNCGLFHLALERGMSSYLNPMSIPVYEWKDGEAIRTPLKNFERTPLKTYYLQKDYNDRYEPYYHLCDEPFDYSTVKVDEPARAEKPEAFVLHQNRPNPFNPYTSIEFSIPNGGHARLEIYNSSGQLVDVLVDGYRVRGSHVASWNTGNHSSGVYFYRFRFKGYRETKKMTLLK